MNRKRAMDMAAACVWAAVAVVLWTYPAGFRGQEALLGAAAALALFFCALAVKDHSAKKEAVNRGRMNLPSESELITELALLSEEDTELMTWDMYGKTALVIGRDRKENHVDVDLGGSPYASMVEIEHAVLNFSAGNWYVEDLGSANGLSVKKAADGRLYKLSGDTPCRVERGDCLHVGLNRLLLR